MTTNSPNLSRAEGTGRVAMIALGITAAWPLFIRALGFVLPQGVGIGAALQAIKGLLTLVAVIVYLVWLYRVTAAMRDAGGSKFSPGMAVGGWFIPFANFVLPMLSLKDVLDRLARPMAWIAPAWWAAYFVSILFNIAYGNPAIGMRLYSVGGAAVGYLATAVHVAAFGLWALAVKSVHDANKATAGVTATA